MTNSDLSARTIASQFGLSLRTLFGFYETANQSLERSIIKMRLEHAAELRIADEYRHESVLNISILAGFKEVSHFSRRFRDAYGAPPSEWRSEQAKTPGSNSVR